ncbi:CHAP domain-containing protein [Agromyces protaetiae]|uniref:CHAP domain-containing protein n=1 Tax=Agromyces protaetiae TaxID=2509455 RepID=A0A4P6FDC9_9MICO|nr:amidase domain-containing protein [Agromyces protaetiae]QAY72369.1 CHAP domain-containing protein [Agromyces protaetiae]
MRRWAAITSATAIVGVSALGAVGVPKAQNPAYADASNESGEHPMAPVADEVRAAIAADPGPAVTSGLSVAAVPFTGGAQVTVQGSQLDEITQVTVGGAPAQIVAADATTLTFAVPATSDTALGDVPVVFADETGEPAPVGTPAEIAATQQTSSVASVDSANVSTGSLAEIAAASAQVPAEASATAVLPRPATSLTLTYTTDPRIDAQVGYILAHWSNYNAGQYPVIDGYDCANFASQSLIERGWTMDGGWFYDANTGATSPSWTSSTAMRDWLYSRPDLATALDDSQRAQVKVGDIAQFDWDDSGDRDHTAIVTRVDHNPDGSTKVWVGSHTKDVDYWDVDVALASGGGSVYYFSLR